MSSSCLQSLRFLQAEIHVANVPLNLSKRAYVVLQQLCASCQPSTAWHAPEEQSSLPVQMFFY